MSSKRDLQARLNKTEERLADFNELQYRFTQARYKLEELGYREERTPDDLFGLYDDASWKIPLKHQSEAAKAEEVAKIERDKAREAELAEAREAGRREALEKVIDALELKDYQSHGYKFFGYLLDGQPAGPDKFWDDIQVTLKEREDRAAAEARAAQERRISGLKKPENSLILAFDPADAAVDGISFFYRGNGDTIESCDMKKPAKKPKKKEASK